MFTKQQIEEIASKLKLISKKDSSFGTINDIVDNDEFPILDNKVNRKTSIRSLVNYLNGKIGKPVNYFTVKVEVKDSNNNTINDATVLINDKEGYAAPVQEGSIASIVVRKNGYRTETRSIIVNEDTNVSITLVKVSNKCTVEIQYEPSDATIWLNSGNGYIEGITKAQVEVGSFVGIKVEKEGYKTHEQNYLITGDTYIQISLTKIEEQKYTLTITPTPSDAKVTMTINGVSEVKRIEKVNKGTRVYYKIEKSGYVTIEDSILVDSDISIERTLSQIQYYTLKLIPSPIDDVDIVINVTDGVNPQEFTINSSSENQYAEYTFSSVNNTITYTATKEGYGILSNTETLTENTERNLQFIVEVPEVPLYSVSFNIVPDNATLLIDGEVVDASETIQRYRGTTIQIECRKEGYKTHTSTYTFEEDNQIIDITLSSKKTLTISSTDASFNNLAVPSSETTFNLVVSLVDSISGENTNVTQSCNYSLSNEEMANLTNSENYKLCTISANTNTENRTCIITATLTVDGETYTATYTLIQLGQDIEYFLSIDKGEIVFDCNGETINNQLTIFSNVEWTIS